VGHSFLFPSDNFATFGSIKENPNGQVITEILELVFNPSYGEKNISRLEWGTSFATDKFTAASGDEINLVARVWLLWIAAARGVDFHL
jgi:hypothetical protein